jgi:hypothetical protein
MAIKNWHWGKLIICWVVGGVLSWFSFSVLAYGRGPEDTGQMILAVVYFLLMIGSPIFLIVVTWKWLSGKEKPTTQQ